MFKNFISRFILWAFVPRAYKQCKKCCLRCEYYSTCRNEVLSQMSEKYSYLKDKIDKG